MKETQNIEYKEIWKDDYLKCIAGFANASGGKLYVGINDSGEVIGVTNTKKLLEDIPNKIVSILGIIQEVHLREKENKSFIEIIINPSSVPISYKGAYYIRSGSTMQELKGSDLQNFILRKIGKTFDELSTTSAGINEIDEKTVNKFIRKAIKANRISSDAEKDSIAEIIANLKLQNGEGKLKNAAILLFGKDTLKFFKSAVFKIGRFGQTDHDLRFQDVIEGNIFEMPDKVIETLRSKYLVSPIRYEGLQRIEELEYPEEALREAILNAVIHKDYTGVHTQMSIYNDKLILWNDGMLPDGLNAKMLKGKHPSKPRNIDIANIFFKAGYIEAWGRGIAKIIDGCKNAGLPEPDIEEYAGGFQITFYKGDQKSVEKSVEKGVEKSVEKIAVLMSTNPYITQKELSGATGLSRRGVEKNISLLKKAGKIKRIGPAKGGHWEVVRGQD